jgi:hypothetical protein
MKSDHLNKFFHELLLYFWIPLIVALVAYIFFELRDPTLGISVLIGATVVYAMARLFATYKKWWLLLIALVVVLGLVGIYFLRVPAFSLTINDMEVTGTTLNLPEGTITINPAPQGNGQYNKNMVVTLTAEPAAGYDWISWNGTDNDGANPTTVTMSDDKSIHVTFETRCSLIINNQQVIGSVVSFTEGLVTVNPPPSSADGKYPSGTRVTLTVQTNPGYSWVRWTGTENDYANPTTITMDSGKQITLLFAERYELTLNGQTVTSNIIDLGEGLVTIEPAPGIDGKYALNTTVTLTANPDSGYIWQSWSGTNDFAANPTTVLMNSDKHISVNWGEAFVVTINNQQLTGPTLTFEGGTVVASPAPLSNGTYAKNTHVTFTAVSAPGYRFGWWIVEINSSSNPINIAINSDKNITVVFIKTYALNISIQPAGGGNVTIQLAGGGTVSSGNGPYDENTTIALTAAALTGYRFDRWEGDVTGNTTSPTITVTMNANKNITAVFIKLVKLMVTITPEGGGTVSSQLALGGTVSSGNATYDISANVTLTATPAAGYVFDHWEIVGSDNVTSNPVTITMNTDKSVTAVFLLGTTGSSTNVTRAIISGDDVALPVNHYRESALINTDMAITAAPDGVISPRFSSPRHK